MTLANLSKRETALLYLALTMVFLSLFYSFLFRPCSKQWHSLNQRILNKEIELERKLRYLSQKDEVENIYRSYIGQIESKRPEQEEVIALLNKVEKVASASGIHIANIRPKPVQDLKLYKKYILEMNCEATMENYIAFIYNLHQSTQLVRVEELKLTSQGKANQSLKAHLLITKVVTTQQFLPELK